MKNLPNILYTYTGIVFRVRTQYFTFHNNVFYHYYYYWEPVTPAQFQSNNAIKTSRTTMLKTTQWFFYITHSQYIYICVHIGGLNGYDHGYRKDVSVMFNKPSLPAFVYTKSDNANMYYLLWRHIPVNLFLWQ